MRTGVQAFSGRRVVAHSLAVAAILLVALLATQPPMLSPFYPVCPIHEYFGILCPGCGATRALAALLHAQFLEAIRLNALIMLLLPFLAAMGVVSYRRALRSGPFRWPQIPPVAVYGCLAITALFTMARNLNR
jgi:hypothetical protein